MLATVFACSCQNRIASRVFRKGLIMPSTKVPQTTKYVYWQQDDAWLGYLQDYPDYWTQGDTLDDLLEHLKDLYQDLTSGQIPSVRKVGELVVS